jgi:hypothetical protein
MITRRHGIYHGRQIQNGNFGLSKSECGRFLKQKSFSFWLLRESDAFEKRTLVERLGDSNNLLLSRLSLFQQLKGHIKITPRRD